MDPTLQMIAGVVMRWAHITTVILLIGGACYAAIAKTPLARPFASKIPLLAAVLFASGLYNFLTKSSYPPGYHMWFGIKFLLALHPLSMLILLSRPAVDESKQRRWLSGILYSGLAVVALSAVLRWMTLNPAVKLP